MEKQPLTINKVLAEEHLKMMPLKKKAIVAFKLGFLLFFFLMPFREIAQAQWSMGYHGYLDEGPGIPLTGKVSITFSLYNIPQGGEALWSEVHDGVEVTNGFYKVILGSMTPIDLPCNEQYFVGVRVGKDGTLPSEKAEISEVTSALLDTIGTGSRPEKRDALLVLVPDSSESTALAPQEGASSEGLGAAAGPVSGQAIEEDIKETAVATELDLPVIDSVGSPACPSMDDLEARMTRTMSGVEGVDISRNERGVNMTLRSDLLFDPYNSVLKPNGNDNLKRIASLLEEFPRTRIEVGVHTDSIGTYEYNDQLAAKRVSVIKKALKDLGVSPKRITAVAFGERQPIVDNGFDWGRRINRRVEITFLPQE